MCVAASAATAGPTNASGELADIDRDRYTILAVDLRVDGPVTATVYIDRVKHGIARHAEIAALSESQGEIPVVPFDIPKPTSQTS
jgi:hypothetical protein